MRRNTTNSGFTLVELLIVIVVLGVSAAYAFVRNAGAGAYTQKSQADMLAADIRHVQAMAMNWGYSLQITAGSTGYSVSCVNAGSTAPCNSSPVLNPSTGSSYSVTLSNGVTMSGPATLSIDNFGKPSAAASYVLSSGSSTYTVAVAALTGKVTVGTP
jgi:MSHA pilin protein MshA